RVYPNTLTFFNAAVGGPDGGAEYLTDSNIDWGQHLKRLKRWMDRHGVRHVNLAYFGSAVPSYYGIDRTDLPGSALARRVTPKPQLPGYVAISRTVLSGVYLPPRWRYYYRGFQDLEPVAEIGHTILVYWVDTWPEPGAPISSEAEAAVVRRLSDELIRAHAYRHAARHYREYLRYHPQDATALGNLGVALASTGDRGAALDAFRRAVAAAPGDVRTRNNLTLALLEHGARQIRSVDAVVRRRRRSEVRQVQTAHGVAVHPSLQALQVLSPVDVGIGQIVGAAIRTADGRVEERQRVRVDARDLDAAERDQHGDGDRAGSARRRHQFSRARRDGDDREG
ncbi:MAG TPA: tetratricopeptide repeat protein, partial [Thermomicrobiales bacterium]|nr:tetratricopeptide repeat protein [Thermomicrobiales bacterium]